METGHDRDDLTFAAHGNKHCPKSEGRSCLI